MVETIVMVETVETEVTAEMVETAVTWRYVAVEVRSSDGRDRSDS